MPNKKNTCYGYYKKVTISLDVEDTELADELAAQLGLPIREVISTALVKLKESMCSPFTPIHEVEESTND